MKFITSTVNSYFDSAEEVERGGIARLNQTCVAREMPDGTWQVRIEDHHPMAPEGETLVSMGLEKLVIPLLTALPMVPQARDREGLNFKQAFDMARAHEENPLPQYADGKRLFLRQIRKPEDDCTHWRRHWQPD